MWGHAALMANSLLASHQRCQVWYTLPTYNDTGPKLKDRFVDADIQELAELYLYCDENHTGPIKQPCLYCQDSKKIISNDAFDILKVFESFYMNEISSFIKLENANQQYLDIIKDSILFGVTKVVYAPIDRIRINLRIEMLKQLHSLNETLKHKMYVLGGQISSVDIFLASFLIRFERVFSKVLFNNATSLTHFAYLKHYLHQIINDHHLHSLVSFNDIDTFYGSIPGFKFQGTIDNNQLVSSFSKPLTVSFTHRTLSILNK